MIMIRILLEGLFEPREEDLIDVNDVAGQSRFDYILMAYFRPKPSHFGQ